MHALNESFLHHLSKQQEQAILDFMIEILSWDETSLFPMDKKRLISKK